MGQSWGVKALARTRPDATPSGEAPGAYPLSGQPVKIDPQEALGRS
eukprot:CAMPEP_0180133772 /NCGR_PEP_ID=MMETSP0986-20121125/9735_1 /TAXON_ID=697907 /ORGANISM="non described non described, Strain CCMP2293" /LENGTH=45 /DNA_ID= /DNA_START= /DNA_END= /DNA_ORIENTATION=